MTMVTDKTSRVQNNIFVVIPNWNGRKFIDSAIGSLEKQSMPTHIVVVDNGSIDGSVEHIEAKYPNVTVLTNKKNLGFTGGVNKGISYAISLGAQYVALLNNDARVDKNWLKNLVQILDSEPSVGIAASKILNNQGAHIDSVGESYTVWGIHFPIGRGDKDIGKYDQLTEVFAASGGASLYRVKMLEEIGLFDQDFFAYYEDIDISFRAQLAGWKIVYTPKAIVYHQIGGTSNKIKGFTTYQTLKNLPMLLAKNLPGRYMSVVLPRYAIVHIAFFIAAVSRGQFLTALRGDFMGTVMLLRSLSKRRRIQTNRKVSDEYIWDIMTHDLPPDATRLRALRSKYRKLIGRHG